jgi:hypothetical protein
LEKGGFAIGAALIVGSLGGGRAVEEYIDNNSIKTHNIAEIYNI